MQRPKGDSNQKCNNLRPKEIWGEGGAKKPAKLLHFLENSLTALPVRATLHSKSARQREREREREGTRLRVRVCAKMLTLASWGISNILFMLINQYITLLTELFYSLFIGV